MKKFLTILALAAVALNFSSVSLWAEDMKSEPVTAAVDQVKDDEAKLAETALNADENIDKADETKKVEASVPAVPAVATEVKKDEKTETTASVPATEPAKVS